MSYYRKEHYLESLEFPFYISPYIIEANRFIVDPHSHEFIELVYISEGVGEHIYRNRSYPISRGDIFVIEPEVQHAYRVVDPIELEVYNVLFLPSLLEYELRNMANVTPFVNFFYVEPLLREPLDFQHHLKLSVNEGLEVKIILDKIWEEFKSKRLGYRLFVKSLMIELFITLARYYENRISQPMSSMKDEKTMIDTVCEFIRVHYAKPIRMEQIYQMCGMSHSTFPLKFKKYVGKTFTEYRNEIRIDISRELLSTTDDKVIHIARDVGFEDLSYFNKLFKRLTGMTPGQYRARSLPAVTFSGEMYY